jgi:hypothetical protein
MEMIEFIWDDSEGGNVEHITDNDVTIAEAEYVVQNPVRKFISRSSGRPGRAAITPEGRRIAVIFEWVDELTVYPITAYQSRTRK